MLPLLPLQSATPMLSVADCDNWGIGALGGEWVLSLLAAEDGVSL